MSDNVFCMSGCMRMIAANAPVSTVCHDRLRFWGTQYTILAAPASMYVPGGGGFPESRWPKSSELVGNKFSILAHGGSICML